MSVSALFAERCELDSDIRAHLPTLHRLVLWLDAKVVLELGVRTGNSTVALLAGLEKTDGHLTSFDWNQPVVPEEIAGSSHWTFVIGDSLELEPQAPAAVDLLFVDTNHHYDTTRAELLAYGPRTSGAIALHDSDELGTRMAVAQWMDEHPTDVFFNDARDHGLSVILRGSP